MRSGRFWIEFQPCKDKPSTHAWSTVESLSSNRFLLFLVLVSLTVLGLHLSIQTWWETYLHPTRLSMILVSLFTPCGKEIKQSHYPWEAEQFEPNFNPCKVNLTHTLGIPLGHSQATVGFSFRFMDQGHSPRLQRTAILCTRNRCATYNKLSS